MAPLFTYFVVSIQVER